VPNYDEIAVDLQLELERVLSMRENLNRQAERLQAAIKAIEELAEGSDQPIVEVPLSSLEDERGFTDQIRAIFRANPLKSFTAVAMRNVLIERNPELDPKITLIHAHNTLKRLWKQEEIVVTQAEDGRTAYKAGMKKLAPVVDLMAALKESLAKMEGHKKIPSFRAELEGSSEPKEEGEEREER
jgi:hypothetical protein